MKELNELIEDLYKHLAQKENTLVGLDGPTTTQQGYLNLRKNDIENFKNLAKQVETNPIHKKAVLDSFTEGAEVIKQRIDEIQ